MPAQECDPIDVNLYEDEEEFISELHVIHQSNSDSDDDDDFTEVVKFVHDQII